MHGAAVFPGGPNSDISPLHLLGLPQAGRRALPPVSGSPCDQHSVGTSCSRICLYPWRRDWPPSSLGFWCLHSARHKSSSLGGNRIFKGQKCWKLGWTRFPETEYLPEAIKNSSGPFSAGWMSTGLMALAFSGTTSSVDARSKMRLPENLCKQSKRCSTAVARTQILPGPLMGSQAFPAGLSDPCLCPAEL